MSGGSPWRTVWVLATLSLVAFGTVIYAFSVLLTQGAAGGEFSNLALSAAAGAAGTTGGVLALAVGRRADRRGVRTMVGLGGVLGGLGMASLAVASSSWQIVVAGGALLGPALAMTCYEPAFVAVGRAVPATIRHRALGLITLVGGIAGPVYLSATGWLVEAVGWRSTAWALGGLYVLAGLAAAAVLPGVDALPEATGGRRTTASFVTDPRYRWYSVGTVLSAFGIQAVLYHRVAVFEEAGFPVTSVVSVAAVAGLVTLPARYGAPVLTGRFPAPMLHAAAVGVVAASVGLMAVPGWGSMAAHFTLFGLGFGSLLPMRAIVMDRWYGGAHFGRAMGLQWTVASLVAASAPWLVGLSRSALGGYEAPMGLVAVVLALAAVATAWAAVLPASGAAPGRASGPARR